ncbi:MAG: heavy metal translocating P-type ATPase, partial [Bacteroidota bacterium]
MKNHNPNQKHQKKNKEKQESGNHHHDEEKDQHHHDEDDNHDDHDEKGHEDHSDHDHQDHHAHMIKDFRTRFWVSLALSLPIVVLAPMIQGLLGYEFRFEGDRYVQFALSSIVFFYGGWPFFKGLKDELKDRAPGMMTLIALAITVAYVYSSAVVFGLEGKIFFWELATLIAVMLLGHWIEMKSVMGASNALEELAKLMPSEATRINDNDETETVSLSDLKADDLILVKPGEKIPADGEIKEGETNVNEAMITGESKPVTKKEGDEVIGGSVNDNGTIKIVVKHTEKDSYLSKVIGMVEEAQESKSKTQNFANRAAGWLFYIALGGGLITLATWLALGREFEFALERMVTVMVISCPHALGLAVPLVVAISTSVSAQKGLLIRNRTAFENARKITAIIFDKTGTLTKGEFGVSRYKSVNDDHSDDQILSIAASLESQSEHPIASGILSKAEEKELDFEEAKDFSNIKGKGIKASLNGKEIKIVGPGYLKENEMEQPEDAFKDEGETVVFVVVEEKLAGYIALADEIREESHEAIKTLKERDIKIIMATG